MFCNEDDRPPTTDDHPAQNVSSVKIEKPCSNSIKSFAFFLFPMGWLSLGTYGVYGGCIPFKLSVPEKVSSSFTIIIINIIIFNSSNTLSTLNIESV